MDFFRSVWCVCGLPFDAVYMAAAVDCINKAIIERRPYFLSTPNVNYLMAAQTDKAFRESVFNSDLSVADGMPVIWIARLLNIPLPERVAGSDLMGMLFAEKKASSIRIFFLAESLALASRHAELLIRQTPVCRRLAVLVLSLG